MTATRRSRDDVIEAAGRLFAERGYHGTSMRDLGRELGLHGSSLYSHITSKESLLLDVIERGAELFQESADRAMTVDGSAMERLRALVGGHLDVVLDHVDEALTFLNEARVLDDERRNRIVELRDRYEQAFRQTIAEAQEDGDLPAEVEPKLATIFLLSILNAVERWYDPNGPLDRHALADAAIAFMR